MSNTRVFVLGNKKVGIMEATVDGQPAIIMNNDPDISDDYVITPDALTEHEVAIVFKTEEHRRSVLEAIIMPSTDFRNKKDDVYKYEVRHMEYKPGWGIRLDERRYYASEKAARDHVEEFNKDNDKVKPGAWRMDAEYIGLK